MLNGCYVSGFVILKALFLVSIVCVEDSQKQHATLIRCLSCKQTKKFPNNPKHQLWVDQPEAQLENQLQSGTNNHHVFRLFDSLLVLFILFFLPQVRNFSTHWFLFRVKHLFFLLFFNFFFYIHRSQSIIQSFKGGQTW